MPIAEILVAALLSMLAGLLSMLVGRIIRHEVIGVGEILRRLLKRESPAATYSERLARLMESLRESSSEVDAVLAELTQVAGDRERAAAKLDQQLKHLEDEEQTLQKRIEQLQALPIPVAEYLVELTKAGERSSAKRDYLLFGAGVVVTTLLSIFFFLLQGR